MRVPAHQIFEDAPRLPGRSRHQAREQAEFLAILVEPVGEPFEPLEGVERELAIQSVVGPLAVEDQLQGIEHFAQRPVLLLQDSNRTHGSPPCVPAFQGLKGLGDRQLVRPIDGYERRHERCCAYEFDCAHRRAHLGHPVPCTRAASPRRTSRLQSSTGVQFESGS